MSDRKCSFDERAEVARITFPDSRHIIYLCEEHRNKMLDALNVKDAVLRQLAKERTSRQSSPLPDNRM